ncbi:MAG: rRNA maturation RNase YbeY [Betaproteobacteria bacterium]|nr:rRNA maturation RNase YbeY [Betaproteobacteria bacterium]
MNEPPRRRSPPLPSPLQPSPSRRLDLSVQYAARAPVLPSRAQIRLWVRTALDHASEGQKRGGKITVRLVDAEEGRSLNHAYRGKDYATNVLSFAYEDEAPGVSPTPSSLIVGDLAVCAPVVAAEARAGNKPLLAHYAHLIVHGMLHLQGYDHERGKGAARKMETMERQILAALGYPDPYQE